MNHNKGLRSLYISINKLFFVFSKTVNDETACNSVIWWLTKLFLMFHEWQHYFVWAGNQTLPFAPNIGNQCNHLETERPLNPDNISWKYFNNFCLRMSLSLSNNMESSSGAATQSKSVSTNTLIDQLPCAE